MPSASANFTRMDAAWQTALGTAASGGFFTVATTGGTVSPNPTKEESARITGDRATPGVETSFADWSGGIGSEIAYPDQNFWVRGLSHNGGDLRPYIEGAVSGFAVTAADDTYATPGVDWVAGMVVEAGGWYNAGNNSAAFVAQSGSGTDALVAPDGTADETAPAGAYLRMIGIEASDLVATANGIGSTTTDLRTFGIPLGASMRPKNFAVAGMNTPMAVLEINQNEIVLDGKPASWSAGAAITGGDLRIHVGDVYTHGKVLDAFTGQFLAPASETDGKVVEDCVVDQLVWTMVRGLMNAQATVLGGQGGIKTLVDSTPDAAIFGSTMSGARSVARVVVGGTTVGVADLVKSATLTFANNLDPVSGLSYDYNVDYELNDATLAANLTLRGGTWQPVVDMLADTKKSLLIPAIKGNSGYCVYAEAMDIMPGSDLNPQGRNAQMDMPLNLMSREGTKTGKAWFITVFHSLA